MNSLNSIVISWVFTGLVQQGLCGGLLVGFADFVLAALHESLIASRLQP